MLRWPVSLFMAVVGAIGVGLGAHGVYVYFYRLETLFSGGGVAKLFLELDVPIRLQEAVVWMSYKGLQSWFIPAVFLGGGMVLWSWSGITHKISIFLARMRLW